MKVPKFRNSSSHQRIGACLLGVMLLMSNVCCEFKNAGMLLNAGKYFYNYRMETNLFLIKNIMSDMGFDPSDMLIVRADNMICNPNSVNCPSLRAVPSSVTHSIAGQPFESDYSMRDNNPSKLLELLSGFYEAKDSNYKRIDRDENTNFFYYTSGHGGNLYYKIQDTEVIFAQQVHDYLGIPALKYKQREGFLLSDSCGAGTVFSAVQGNHATYMIGSSSWDQKAWSYDFDPIFSMPLNDRFTYHFDQKIGPLIKKQEMVSVHKMKGAIDHSMMDADYLSYNLLNRNDKQIYLNDFVAQSERREVKTMAANADALQELLEGFFGA